MHEEMGTVPGGLHLEMTGDNVTECIGGGSGVTGTACCNPASSATHHCIFSQLVHPVPHSSQMGVRRLSPLRVGVHAAGIDLGDRYHTHCDPRLNAEQALEMSFFVASRLRRSEHL